MKSWFGPRAGTVESWCWRFAADRSAATARRSSVHGSNRINAIGIEELRAPRCLSKEGTMMGTHNRFVVGKETDPEWLENSLTHHVYDRHRGRYYGWYTCYADAWDTACWLNATNGKVD